MNLLNSYGAVLAILTLFVGAAVYVFSSFGKGRRDYLRTDNLDLKNSNDLLRQKCESLEVNMKNQAETIANLRDVATQTPAVTQLLEQTAKQHSQVITQLTELTKEMSKLTREFSHVAQAITKNSKAQDKNSQAQDDNTRSRA